MWANQIKPLADEAFTHMLSLVRGQNFYMEVGVLHMERWLGRLSSLTQTYLDDFRIPLKSASQLRQQERRVATGKALVRQMTKTEAKKRDFNIPRRNATDDEMEAVAKQFYWFLMRRDMFGSCGVIISKRGVIF